MIIIPCEGNRSRSEVLFQGCEEIELQFLHVFEWGYDEVLMQCRLQGVKQKQ